MSLESPARQLAAKKNTTQSDVFCFPDGIIYILKEAIEEKNDS
jgi:hypothetical protein